METETRPLFAPDPFFSTDGVLTESELLSLYVRHVVAHCGGNKAKAAKALGIHRRSVYRRLKGLP